jgi:hypothetical protein
MVRLVAVQSVRVRALRRRADWRRLPTQGSRFIFPAVADQTPIDAEYEVIKGPDVRIVLADLAAPDDGAWASREEIVSAVVAWLSVPFALGLVFGVIHLARWLIASR